ncbi:GNAT family N-acetyltransferase [Pseudobacteriovorax antillogorgiicola]|uniref:Acetyltransferase (GNAT) domain-containing protein n=1 Tax=Pseudobacteriovorax antillogorgiicola TaxID=1513793 RepID=A0A1Y6BM05_9BACT|nr:GNAT family N-acetyltransferase [Pseudobacteriovorax antillogorgiicola]TCS55586.1 acetyltransferase (GNAT) family protein [Pseudobacteriovorax antillogorgiicola]SMF10610.1 Acetyltransferase (GNAT) domain-containing protein [Pseudobacteriovorax antillogorgiicola]
MNISTITTKDELEKHIPLSQFIEELHEMLKPYEDSVEEITGGIGKCFSSGGKVVVAMEEEKLLGTVVILKTGMSGYIPDNLLLYVAVKPETRGKGLGRKIIETALDGLEGSVKLHVEHDNPASRLYERLGFTSKYREMRISLPLKS